MRLTSLRICSARFPMGRFTLAMWFSAEWEIKCARLKMEHNVPNRISVQLLKAILSSPSTCSTVYYCPLWVFISRTLRFRFILKAFPYRKIEEALCSCFSSHQQHADIMIPLCTCDSNPFYGKQKGIWAYSSLRVYALQFILHQIMMLLDWIQFHSDISCKFHKELQRK